MLKRWDDLPEFMRIPEVKPYYNVLSKKKGQIVLKRTFDIVVALLLFILLLIPMLLIALVIKMDSKGPIFFRQERITAYGKMFRIHKFRTMVTNAERIGAAVTTKNDSRVTKVGAYLRRLRLDELPQLIDVITGNMSFVGTRPEIEKYVKQYKSEYNATLLLPAGITSEASIKYKDEENLLNAADNVDRVYVEEVLPEKMRWNLEGIKNFSFIHEIETMFKTVAAVFGKHYY